MASCRCQLYNVHHVHSARGLRNMRIYQELSICGTQLRHSYKMILIACIFLLAVGSSAQSSQQCVNWIAIQNVLPEKSSTLNLTRQRIIHSRTSKCQLRSYMWNPSQVSTVYRHLLHGLNGGPLMFEETHILATL